MRKPLCRCGHSRYSHAMEYGRGGALCRVRGCKCMDWAVQKRKNAPPSPLEGRGACNRITVE